MACDIDANLEIGHRCSAATPAERGQARDAMQQLVVTRGATQCPSLVHVHVHVHVHPGENGVAVAMEPCGGGGGCARRASTGADARAPERAAHGAHAHT